MNFERSAQLGFLLSFGALGIACPAGGGTDTEAGTGDSTGDPDTTGSTTLTTSSTTSPTSSSSSSTTSSTTADDTTTSTDTTGPDTTGEASTGTPESTGEASTGEASTGEGSTGATTGDPGGLCEQVGANYVVCYPKYAGMVDELIMQCEAAQMYYAAYSPECGSAFDELLACLGNTDCAEINAGACTDAETAVTKACGG